MTAAGARVLEHVDGQNALRDIAVKANLSLPDTIEASFELLSRGIIAGDETTRDHR